VDRATRNLQQSKQKNTSSLKSVSNVNKNDLTEGIPKPIYIQGKGLRLVCKYNGQLWYFNGSTTLS